MQPQNKRKLMLSVLAFLLVARFVVQPIFNWQQQQIIEIASQTKKQVKVQRVIDRLPKISQALRKLQQTNQTLEAFYSHQTSLEAFKLQQQQELEQLFEQHNIKIENYNWVAEMPGPITQVRAKISFTGKTKDFALLQLAIAGLPKLLEIGEWTLHIKRLNDHSLGNARGSLLLLAYNIPAAQESEL